MPLQPYKHRQHGRLATLHWPEALDEPTEPHRMNGSFNNSSLFLEWMECGWVGGGKMTNMAARQTTLNIGGLSMARFVLVRDTGLMKLQLVSSKLQWKPWAFWGERAWRAMRYILYFTWSQCKLRATVWLNWLEWCRFSLISRSLPINSIRISVVMHSYNRSPLLL